jgi:hypothetical protein
VGEIDVSPYFILKNKELWRFLSAESARFFAERASFKNYAKNRGQNFQFLSIIFNFARKDPRKDEFFHFLTQICNYDLRIWLGNPECRE